MAIANKLTGWQHRHRWFASILAGIICALLFNQLSAIAAHNPIPNATNQGRSHYPRYHSQIPHPRSRRQLRSLWLDDRLQRLRSALHLQTGNHGTDSPPRHPLPEISPDGLTYRVVLRQGVTFHDGSPFNAQAMVFSLNRFMRNGGKPSFLLTDTIAKIIATGDRELTFVLKKPFAAFPALLAFPGACAVSPKVYEIGEGKFLPEQLVGTGRYKLTAVRSDSLQLRGFRQLLGR